MGLHAFLLDLATGCLYVFGGAWVVGAVYFSVRSPGGAGRKLLHFVRTMIPEPWLLLLAPLFGVAVSLVPRRVWAEVSFWHPAIAVPGAVLLVAATGLLLWARWVLGTMWASGPLVQRDHELRTTGPYAVVRHPIYAGFVGMLVGAMFTVGFGSWIAWLAGGLAFVAWRVHAENRMMAATFGDAYREYSARVPALVPFTRRSRPA